MNVRQHENFHRIFPLNPFFNDREVIFYWLLDSLKRVNIGRITETSSNSHE